VIPIAPAGVNNKPVKSDRSVVKDTIRRITPRIKKVIPIVRMGGEFLFLWFHTTITNIIVTTIIKALTPNCSQSILILLFFVPWSTILCHIYT
jgi:hypothetical protein